MQRSARVGVGVEMERRAAARKGGGVEAEKGRGRVGKDAVWALKQGVSSSGIRLIIELQYGRCTIDFAHDAILPGISRGKIRLNAI
jgi:hypothetical protein